MTSTLQRDPVYGAANTVDAVNDKMLINERLKRLGMSPRQVELNRYYAYFRTQQHDSCAIDWDGSRHVGEVEREAIVTAQAMPMGFVDLGSTSDLPLRYRRPSVPCHLCRTIVGRFSDLLFSEQTHPTWKVLGDPDTEAWVNAVTNTYGLWSQMGLVRDLGGSQGSVAVGFKIIKVRVVFEEFDARWCFPKFKDDDPTELEELEVRYIYPQSVQDKETGEWKEENYWYRRVINEELDCLWVPMPVGDGDEPNWTATDKDGKPKYVKDIRAHGMGFVPIVWTQNMKVSGDIDGDPDCYGAYDYFDRIGELDSQAHKSGVRNADPTPVVTTDGDLGSVKLGSDSALKLEKGGGANYLESNGSAADAAAKQSERLRARALEVCACVLPDQEDAEGAPKTATEMNKRSAAMYAKASKLREQYGNRCVVRLMTKLVHAVRKAGVPKVTENGVVVGKVTLPPTLVDGKLQELKLGTVAGAQLELVWPPYATPSPEETNATVSATNTAVQGGFLSKETAVRHVAPHFNIDDPKAEMDKIAKQQPAGPADMAGMSLRMLNQGAE